MLDSITEYFDQIPSAHRLMIIISGLLFFSLIETAQPLMSLSYKRWKHAMVNIFFTMTTILINLPLAFLLVQCSDWAVLNSFGLLYWLSLDGFVFLLLGLMFLDLFSSWLPHWIEHHVVWMWKFHVIHHTDQNVDTTTANRHHPGESVIRYVFTILATLLVGAPIWLVLLYQSLSVILSQFNHANIILPKWLDSLLAWLIVTPDMHRVHHHYRMPYSDKNYGNIFSLWDRIFKTYIKVDNSKLNYGLDTYNKREDHSDIWQMLKIPFQSYRKRIEYEQEERL